MSSQPGPSWPGGSCPHSPAHPGTVGHVLTAWPTLARWVMSSQPGPPWCDGSCPHSLAHPGAVGHVFTVWPTLARWVMSSQPDPPWRGGSCLHSLTHPGMVGHVFTAWPTLARWVMSSQPGPSWPWPGWSCLGTTVFCGPQNFVPSRGIWPLLRNFHVSAEFPGIRGKSAERPNSVILYCCCNCNEPFQRAERLDVTARRCPTYSVKLRLWKISTFYFKIVTIPTPLTITITPLSAH